VVSTRLYIAAPIVDIGERQFWLALTSGFTTGSPRPVVDPQIPTLGTAGQPVPLPAAAIDSGGTGIKDCDVG